MDMLSQTNPIDSFLGSVLPHGANTEMTARLRQMAASVRVAAGGSAALPQDTAHYLWIARGNARLVAHGAGRQRQVLEFHFAGDLVLVPARGAHGYTLEAITVCELVAVPAAQLRDLACDDAALALVLLDQAKGALALARAASVRLGRKRALERVAGFLLAMRERVGAPAFAGAPIQLPMSRRDISENLAITVESISREVARMRQEGLIETPARAQVRILDPDDLAARAGIFAGAA